MHEDDLRKAFCNKQGLRDLIAHCCNSGGAMAEIGVYRGNSISIFLESGKFDTIYAVDPWLDYTDETTGHSTDGKMWQNEAAFDAVMSESNGVIVKRQWFSVAFSEEVDDHSLDLVYIDANHTYDAVIDDIRAWTPKVKPGGYIAGHDYTTPWTPGVPQAVDELLGNPDKLFMDSSWCKKV